jgi:hypothetical protein
MEEKDEFLLDEINGCRGKKTKMSILNKKKLDPYEMDDLFL